MRRARAIAVVWAATAVLAACSSGPDEPANELEGVDLRPVATITVDEEGIDPATVTVRAGELIEVVNDGEEPHRVTGGTAFDTGTILPGDSVAVVLRDPGRVRFADQAMLDHRGTITVRPAPGAG